MRKSPLPVVTLTFLLALTVLPSVSSADCRKEILLYLDISGSMRPLDRNPTTSPFRRTVEALDELLAQPGLVQADDVVKLRLFGQRIQRRETAAGPGELDAMVERLRSNEITSNLSDLVHVVEDIVAEFDRVDTEPDRRLIIIASDFVHEHQRGLLPDQYAANWQDRTANLGRGRNRNFASSTQQAFLFLRVPPYQDRFAELQGTILGHLAADDPTSEVDLGSMSPKGLAREIQKRLLFPPEISGWVINGEDPTLHVTVRNLNCTSVAVEEIAALCGDRRDEANLPLPPECLTLTPTGNSGSSCETEKDLKSLSCVIGDRIRIRTVLKEGVQRTETVNAANLLEVSPTQGISESQLSRYLKGSLYLYLSLRGYVVDDRPYEFELKRRGHIVASGTFELPDNLSDSWQTYLFPLRVGADAIASERTALELEVAEAKMTTSEIVVIEDKFESKVNLVHNLLLGALVIAGFFGYSKAKRNASSKATTQLQVWNTAWILPIILGAYGYYRASPYLSSSFDWWRWILLSICFAWIVFLWIRQRRLQQIDKQIKDLFKDQSRAEGREQQMPSLETVGDAVRRVEQVAVLGRGLQQIVGRAALFGLILAALLFVGLSLLRPSAVIATPAVQGVIQVVQR